MAGDACRRPGGLGLLCFVETKGEKPTLSDEQTEGTALFIMAPLRRATADSNKSEIVVVFDIEDTKKAKEFAKSPDLNEAMMAAGVLDTPTIYFLESID